MSNLIEITRDNFPEVAEKIKKFVGTTAFTQTHDWINSPLGEKKNYKELDFDFPKYKYSSETVVLVSKGVISIADTVQSEGDFFDCDYDDILELACIGDEIEFLDNAVNVVSYSYDAATPMGCRDIVVWRLYR